MEATAREKMAIFISGQIENGDYISLGANLPVPAAGVLLANLTHAPDVLINVLNYLVNLSDIDVFNDLTQVTNPTVLKWAESIMSMEEQFSAISRMDLCFTGALQVDMYGNTNLIGIGKDFNNLKVRGPGSVGTSTVMATVKKYFIFLNNHSPKSFVEKCDYISAVGWGNGGKDARVKLGLPGGGPEYIITPRAILDFHEESRRMRIKYLFPPATVEEIQENTGFPLLVHEEVMPVPPPEPELLKILRERVDPKGLLRK